MNFSVIIACAGSSSRMEGVDKQLSLINNIPVIIRSVMAFDNIDCVKQIILVTSINNNSDITKALSLYSFRNKIQITCGSDTRQKSIFCGVKLVNDSCDYIAVHDGARPLVRKNDIQSTFNNAVNYKASTLGVPVKDTIKIVTNNIIVSTPERDELFITQTPQVFEKKLYINCMDNALANNLDFTDDCQLVENYGQQVYMTQGHYDNIKITTPDDIAMAECLLKERINP